MVGRFFTPTIGAADSSDAPAVLMLHGIPGTEQNFDVAYALRDVGINCLLFNYRGCWGSTGSYSIHNLPKDIEAAMMWLRQQPRVDKDRICIVGHSLGGYHTLRLASSAALYNRTAEKESGGIKTAEGEFKEAISRVRGFAALCPLVGTDSVGVPLSEELSTEFASMLTGVTPMQLREQWAALPPVRDMLEQVDAYEEKVMDEEKALSMKSGWGMGGELKPSRERAKTKKEVQEEKKVHEEARKRRRRKGRKVLVMTGDVDPLFSVDYYKDNLIGQLDDSTAFWGDWIRKREGDHALCRYRKEVVDQVLSFVCRCTGQSRWMLGERVASVAAKSIAYIPWFTTMGLVCGFLAGRSSVYEEYDTLSREITGRPPKPT